MVVFKEDKLYLENLAEALGVSKGRIKLDDYRYYNIFGRKGHISTDNEYWYLFTQGSGKMQWNNIKRKLSFMEVSQDGDDEGILRCSRLPSEEEAKVIRKVLGMRPSTVLTDVQRGKLLERLTARLEQPKMGILFV